MTKKTFEGYTNFLRLCLKNLRLCQLFLKVMLKNHGQNVLLSKNYITYEYLDYEHDHFITFMIFIIIFFIFFRVS